MENLIRKLARQTKFQNLLFMAKSLNNIALFKNMDEFSKVQSIFLNYLFMYETLYREVELGNVSKFLINEEIYEDAYLLWLKQNKNKAETTQKKSDINLVVSKKINFPKK
jgi:hypothetical protein